MIERKKIYSTPLWIAPFQLFLQEVSEAWEKKKKKLNTAIVFTMSSYRNQHKISCWPMSKV